MKKVSLICTTFRRFECIKRIIAQFNAQTYPNKELILFNTDEEYPYELGYYDERITIVNNGIDYITNVNYTNRGDICRDAVTHASGDYFMLMDDDDIYLPWYVEQGVTKIEELGTDAWKPMKSFFANREAIHLVMNTMEASVIVKMDRIREIGFRNDLTGYEGLSWYTRLRDEKQLDEHYPIYLPSYCFNWGDPAEMAGHKQSGDINNPNNFENHKNASGDHAHSPLFPISMEELNNVYKPYFEFLKTNENEFDVDSYKRYYPYFMK
jgi:glycosyltransferase involved in cell wall biosynthesis